jgi:hypothetical protein
MATRMRGPLPFGSREVEGNQLDSELRLVGDLTMRDTTREVVLDVSAEGVQDLVGGGSLTTRTSPRRQTVPRWLGRDHRLPVMVW